MRACIFCGDDSGKLTNEHVWPQWLRKYPAYEEIRSQHGPRPPWDDFEIVTDEQGRFVHVNKQRPGHVPILPEVRVKVVCATCNNGWMSQLETDAQPLLKRLMADERFDLSEAQQELLALWAAKTMLIYSKCREPIHQPFGDHEFRRLYQTRKPPNNAIIWVGRSDAPQAQVAMSLEPILWTQGDIPPEVVATMQPTAANLYLAAHGVVFIGHFFPDSEVFNDEGRRLLSLSPDQRIGLQRLWPRRGRVRWPLQPIPPERLDGQRQHLARFAHDMSLPMAGLTSEEVTQATDMFKSGVEVRQIWEHFGRGPQADS